MCYVTWCEAQGFNQITPGFYHFEESGHRAWAEKIISMVEKTL